VAIGAQERSGISAAQTVILACVLERTPGAGPYAKLEREQRWLLSGLPDDVVDPVAIHDRYLTGCTLRLRRMRAGSGSGSSEGRFSTRPVGGGPRVTT
jgi:hypothetical protein